VTRRLELGPLLVALGAVLLIVSLFLDWFEGGITAWNAFEVWDVVLAVLAIATLVTAIGLLVPDAALLDASALPFFVGAVVVVVASQIVDPPPAADGAPRDIGCWIALGAATLQLAGTVLTLSRVSFAISVEGRDTRRRVAAVDARDPTTTESAAPLFSAPDPAPREASVSDDPVADAPSEPAAPEADDPPPFEDDGPGTRVEETSSGRVGRTSASRRKT
jgi:hypothetical protein